MRREQKIVDRRMQLEGLPSETMPLYINTIINMQPVQLSVGTMNLTSTMVITSVNLARRCTTHDQMIINAGKILQARE